MLRMYKIKRRHSSPLVPNLVRRLSLDSQRTVGLPLVRTNDHEGRELGKVASSKAPSKSSIKMNSDAPS